MNSHELHMHNPGKTVLFKVLLETCRKTLVYEVTVYVVVRCNLKIYFPLCCGDETRYNQSTVSSLSGKASQQARY